MNNDIYKKQTEDNKSKIPIKCSRCQHIWTYAGSNKYLAGCPLCGIRVSIAKNKIMVLQTESAIGDDSSVAAAVVAQTNTEHSE